MFAGWIRRIDLAIVSSLLADNASLYKVITFIKEKPWVAGGEMNYTRTLSI